MMYSILHHVHRWSFCNSDDDEERQKEIIGADTEPPPSKDQDKTVAAQGTEKEAPPAAGQEAEDGDWEYYYEDLEVGGAGENKKPAQEAAAEAKVEAAAVVGDVVQDGGWECPTCTLRNPLERPGCLACTTERPIQLGAAAVADAVPPPLNATGPPPRPGAGGGGGGLDAYKQLENLDVIPNVEMFECVVCFLEIEPGDGVVLRECLHTFCRYSPHSFFTATPQFYGNVDGQF
jgi:hypothetical protein